MVSELTKLINVLTMFLPPEKETVTKSGYKGRNQSIHPRVVNGKTKYEKVNTCFRPQKGKKEKLIAALKGHLANNPNDTQSQNRLAKLEAA